MASPNVDLTGSVRALVEEALPVLLPGARLAPDSDEIIVPVPGGRARVSLVPLLRQCADRPRPAWPELLADWVAAIRRQLPDEVSPQLGPTDVAQLRLRLTPEAATAEADDYLAMPFGGHFTAVVVVNRPDRLDRLTVAQAAALGVDPTELVRLAVRQTVQRELADLDVRDHTLPNGASVRLLAADGNPFVTTTLMSLRRFLPAAGTDAGSHAAGSGVVADHGALVAAPRYSAVMLHRVDARVLDTAVAIDRVARSMFVAASDPCTDRLFWWYGNEFHPVRVVPGEAGGPAQVRVPEALAAVVARLGG
ncbi:hypothetical protein ACIBTV_23365 [Micromonospora sp. NPDC049366]|uniref:hypothetical protein n=1 Tax=Micromonospora sp. NPDC049366 TaxID=3364271 RepID=UPI0037B7C72D